MLIAVSLGWLAFDTSLANRLVLAEHRFDLRARLRLCCPAQTHAEQIPANSALPGFSSRYYR
jgi:hypothetical protein